MSRSMGKLFRLPQGRRSTVRGHMLHLLRDGRSELLPALHGASFGPLPGE